MRSIAVSPHWSSSRRSSLGGLRLMPGRGAGRPGEGPAKGGGPGGLGDAGTADPGAGHPG
eukprot:999316-Alexandrium_andersonii.AAC.1